VTRTLPGVIKETRALLPVWLACIVAIGAGAIGPVRELNPAFADLALFAYVLGSLALGAQSIGHEHTDRTLEILLAQPADRRRILLTKLGVVAAMLLTLTAAVWSIPANRHDFNPAWSWYGPEVLLLSALLVAPWLTMVCRSAIAGIIFTACLPGLFGTITAVVLLAKNGSNSAISHESRMVAMRIMLGICGIAAAATWRTFLRLEASDRRAELRLPHWVRSASRSASDARTTPGRMQSPAWMLLKKELCLQQMALVIAGLYVLGWTAVALMHRFVPNFLADFPLLPVTILYFALLSIIIGSLASAEERQFGTLEWQLLLPMAIWKQWLLKVAVATGLAIALGVALPIGLSYLHVSEDVNVQGVLLWRSTAFVARMTVIVILLTACGLYLSSLSTGGVRALVLSIPLAFAGAALLPYLADWAPNAAYRIVTYLGRRPNLVRISPNMFYRFWSSDVPLAIAAGLVIILLRFAMQNHRSAERSLSRVSRQAMWVVAYLTAGTVVLTTVEALF
jgi:ABC-2 family transporter